MPILINNKPIEFFKFPGGECHVNVRNLFADGFYNTACTVKAYLYNSDDLVSLALTIDAIRRASWQRAIDLEIPYFPYARQDRVCNPGESLSVKVMADLINSLNCRYVWIYDPHSDVTPALINNVIVAPAFELMHPIKKEIIDQNMILIAPDQGAIKRVSQVAKEWNRPMIAATKVRDTKTGAITKTELNLNLRPESNVNVNFLIVDDICDGGRTFIEIAKTLREQSIIGKLYLYVTHGIFSQGLEVLKPHFNKIYCYHTFLPPDKID